jgi:choline-sulfatase
MTGLAELGLENDTIVIYTADHGDMLGEHGLWDKYVFYEQSVRVPLMFHIPGAANGNTISQTPVSHVQMMPTLLDLCGLPVPSGLDGGSFSSALQEPARNQDTTVFSEFALRTEKARYMIRQGSYKYCYYVSDMPELYNLKDDPQEMRNLAFHPQHRDRVQRMHSRLLEWYKPPEKEKG